MCSMTGRSSDVLVPPLKQLPTFACFQILPSLEGKILPGVETELSCVFRRIFESNAI